MKKFSMFVGLDIHKTSIEIAIAEAGRDGEVRSYGGIDGTLEAFDKVIRKLVPKGCNLHFVYEAGPCGYDVYRHLTAQGFDCVVVAPSKIPRQSGNRIKNDRRDAQMLARLHRAGELTAVYVPCVEDEAMRDLTRSREDAKAMERNAKQRILAALQQPELGAVISVCSSDDRYADDVHYMGGCLLTDNLSWASTMFALNSCPPDPQIVGEKWRHMWLERLEGSGLWIKNWLEHQRRTKFWKRASVIENYAAIKTPVLAVSG